MRRRELLNSANSWLADIEKKLDDLVLNFDPDFSPDIREDLRIIRSEIHAIRVAVRKAAFAD